MDTDTDIEKLSVGYDPASQRILLIAVKGQMVKRLKDITDGAILATYLMIKDKGGAVQIEDKQSGKFIQMVVDQISDVANVDEVLN